MAELEAWQAKAFALDVALQASLVKEPELSANLVVLEDEKKKLEDTAKSLEEKVSESENLTEGLRNEFKLRQDKQDSIEKDLPTSSAVENELTEKLMSAEEKLEQQAKDLALKLLEVNEYLGKVASLEEEIKVHKEQVTVSGKKEASLKAQLEGNLMKLAILEKTVEEVEGKVLEGESKVLESFSGAELFSATNSKFKEELESHRTKVNELQELLNSVHAEKEETRELLATHFATITELTDHQATAVNLKTHTKTQFDGEPKRSSRRPLSDT